MIVIVTMIPPCKDARSKRLLQYDASPLLCAHSEHPEISTLHRGVRPPPPLLWGLAALDARVSTAAPASPALFTAALAAPLLPGMQAPRGRPRVAPGTAAGDAGDGGQPVKGALRAIGFTDLKPLEA